MARYSISDTTLTALGDAVRTATQTNNAEIYTTFISAFPEYIGWNHQTDRPIYAEEGKYGKWPEYYTWYYQVIELPEGINEFHFEGGVNCQPTWKDQMWVAAGDQTGAAENPENLIMRFEPEGGINAKSFTTTARTITFGMYCGNMMNEPYYCFDIHGYGPQKYTPEEMATEINSMVAVNPSLLALTGSMAYKFYQGCWDNFINLYGDKITTENITSMERTFQGSDVKRIPFEINCDNGETYINMSNLCNGARELTDPPIFNNCKPGSIQAMFQNCRNLRYFPEGYGEDWDWSWHTSQTGSSSGPKDSMFQSCYSLRQLPMGLWKYGNPVLSATNTPLKNIYTLYALDEMVDIPFPHTSTANNTSSSMIFYNSFKNMSRIKNFTFASDIGAKKWAKQTLDFTTYFGWCSSPSDIINYNSGITINKRVEDDATYQALKNDPDWFTSDVAYSRYNHDSAVATINSLPDCSEYVATVSNGANIIKFKGAAGEKTDGGAINTLTDEEIAVAAAKGWTVTLQ